MCSRVLRLLLPREIGFDRRRPILSTLSMSPRLMGLPMMKGPVGSWCAPSFARLATFSLLSLPLPLCRGVPSIWGMEERSGGVNGRNGPGLGTRGFPRVGCIDCVGACNKIDDRFMTRDLSPRRSENTWCVTSCRQQFRINFSDREKVTRMETKGLVRNSFHQVYLYDFFYFLNQLLDVHTCIYIPYILLAYFSSSCKLVIIRGNPWFR